MIITCASPMTQCISFIGQKTAESEALDVWDGPQGQEGLQAKHFYVRSFLMDVSRFGYTMFSLFLTKTCPNHKSKLYFYTTLPSQKLTSYSKSAADLLPCSHQADIRMRSHRLLRLDDNKSAASCSKSVHKLSTSCVRTACCKLLKKVWNKLLTTCKKLDGTVGLVTRLFQQD